MVTCAFSTAMSTEEATLMGFQDSATKPATTLLGDKLEKVRVNKFQLCSDKDAVQGQADLLKCSLAMGAAIDAGQHATDQISEVIQPIQDLFRLMEADQSKYLDKQAVKEHSSGSMPTDGSLFPIFIEAACPSIKIMKIVLYSN